MWFYLGLIQLFLGFSVESAILQWLFGSSAAGFMFLAGYFMLKRKSELSRLGVESYNKQERSASVRDSNGSLVEVPLKSEQFGFNRIMTTLWVGLMIFGLLWKFKGG